VEAKVQEEEVGVEGVVPHSGFAQAQLALVLAPVLAPVLAQAQQLALALVLVLALALALALGASAMVPGVGQEHLCEQAQVVLSL